MTNNKLDITNLHIYDGAIAEDVFETARNFLPHAEDFIKRVSERL